MQKIHTILNYKRKIRSNLSTIFFVVLFYFNCNIIYAETVPIIPQDLSRFIFKYYDILSPEDFSNAIGKEILHYYPEIDRSIINEYIYQRERIVPGDLVRFLESNISKNSIYPSIDYKLDQMTQEQWVKYISDTELFITYTSENSRKAESSFGHIAFLFKRDDSMYFNQVVAYLASNFIDQQSGRPTLTSYFNGIFSTLSGKFDNYPLHDALYQSMFLEKRIISLYKLKISINEKKQIIKKIWEISNDNSYYNFFSNNCSTELINLIPGAEKLYEESSFTTPAKIMRILQKSEIISYVGAYNIIKKKNGNEEIIFIDDEILDMPKRSFNQSYSLYVNRDGALIRLSVFHLARPYNGITFNRSNIELMDFSIAINKSKVYLYSFIPLLLEYNPLINDFFGLKLSFITGLKDVWYVNTKSGIFLSVRNFKMEIFYSYNLGYPLNTDVNLNLIYSNNIMDITVSQKIIFDQIELPKLKLSLFVQNNLSLFINTDLSIFSIGLTYYR